MMPTQPFLERHPVCCFCGDAASQEDHVPPKALFARREWPEGFVFPACAACNQGSRQIDQVVSMLARVGIADENPDVAEFQKLYTGVKNNVPQAQPIIEDETEESKRLFEELQSKLPRSGRLPSDTPIVAIDADVFRELDVIFRKLFCALHYKHIGTTAAFDASIFRLCTTNQILDADDPFEWMQFPQIQNAARIERNGRSLSDQFDYNWGVEAGRIFGVTFHMRNTIFGVLVGPLPPERVAEFRPEDVLSLSSRRKIEESDFEFSQP